MPPESDVLFDLRESASLRGFHVAATAMLLAQQHPTLRLSAILGSNGDEALALAALRHQLAKPIPTWQPGPYAATFRVYLFVADGWLDDPVCVAASTAARHRLFGQLFPGPVPTSAGLTVADGNDTQALSRAVGRLLAA